MKLQILGLLPITVTWYIASSILLYMNQFTSIIYLTDVQSDRLIACFNLLALVG